MSDTIPLPIPDPGRGAAEDFVAEHLGDLVSGPVVGSERFRGGQSAADAALAGFDVGGYARRRNEVSPESRRGASMLSPHIRHGLLPLRRVWDHVGGGPSADVRKFRDELLWQEFARHWYARLGTATRRGIRRELEPVAGADGLDGWDRTLPCIDRVVGELERDGWLVNQTRMWLAGDWSIRHRLRWQDGEEVFFQHLLDGSRAANRLGWQWTTGVGSSKHYGFSRWQVEKRAPGWCSSCPRRHDCPIERWPDDPEFVPVERPVAVGAHATRLAGPDAIESTGRPIDAVWLTAESLGDADPAVEAHPDAPLVFVFDRALLRSLRLSAKRLVFLVETLSETAVDRDVELWLGRAADAIGERSVAVTHAPVPGFARHAALVHPAEVHPWPWLVDPTAGSVSSFAAWRKGVREPR